MAVDGVILRMEFLYPPNKDPHYIILLLVVLNDKRTYFVRYEWDYSKELRGIEYMGSHPVHRTQRMPLLLIPFTTSPGFMLVCEDCIALFNNVLSGYGLPRIDRMRPRDPPEEPGSSRRSPLWTQWARPIRRDDWQVENEVIYLCREDGLVRLVEFHNGEIHFQTQVQVGKLEVNVDTAFASLENDNQHIYPHDQESHDLLVAGGNMGDGGLFMFIATEDAKRHQSITSWAPIIDFTTANIGHPIRQNLHGSSIDSGRSGGRERVFASVGRGSRHGGMCELRYGIQALSSAKIDIQPLGVAGIVGMWILPHFTGTLILLTDPIRSHLLWLSDRDGEVREVSDKAANDELGLDLRIRTIAAGSTREGVLIQITERSIYIKLLQRDLSLIKNQEDKNQIIAACVHGGISAMLTAVRKDTEVYLNLEAVSVNETGISVTVVGNPESLPCEPSCISLQAIGFQLYAFVGLLTGSIKIFRCDVKRGLISLTAYEFDGEFAVCDSVVMISKTQEKTDDTELLVLCGLRNGSLEIFQLVLRSDSGQYSTSPSEHGGSKTKAFEATCDFRHCETLSFGSTSVVVRPDMASWSMQSNLCCRALLVCGDNFCRLEYSTNQGKPKSAMVNSVWLTDHDEPSFQQAPITVVAQPDPWNLQNLSSGSLFCIEKFNLHFAELDTSAIPQALPRRFFIGGTPSRIIYSSCVNRLVVGFSKTIVRTARRINGHERTRNRRLLYPTLAFIDPCAALTTEDKAVEPSDVDGEAAYQEFASERTLKIRSHCIGKSGERILGLLDWYLREDETLNHLLVVNTLRARNSGGKPTGQILLYHLSQDRDGEVTPVLKTAIKRDEPVYAVAAFGASSLVYCTGLQIVLQPLSIPERRWQQAKAYALPCQGRSISVHEPFVYITTTKDSLLVFRVDGDTITPQLSDEVARNGLHHLLIPEHSLVMVSDEADIVSGLWQPPGTRLNNSTTTLFEAKLPVSIIRFHKGSIKPSWRRGPSTEPTTILGCSTDGSFYQFEIINEATWRLLRFIQNMAERNGDICPFTYHDRRKRHIEPSTRRHHFMHVDGDTLVRLLERGQPDSETLLKAMLDQDPQPAQRLHDFDTAAIRRERFTELVNAAIEDHDGDPVEVTVNYLRNVLQPVL